MSLADGEDAPPPEASSRSEGTGPESDEEEQVPQSPVPSSPVAVAELGTASRIIGHRAGRS